MNLEPRCIYRNVYRGETWCGALMPSAYPCVRVAEVRWMVGDRVCQACRDESQFARAILWSAHRAEELMWN